MKGETPLPHKKTDLDVTHFSCLGVHEFSRTEIVRSHVIVIVFTNLKAKQKKKKKQPFALTLETML